MDYDDEDSFSSEVMVEANGSLDRDYDKSYSVNPSDDLSPVHKVDLLFDLERGRNTWIPQQPPEVLGELLESRYMLPLQLPSDPSLLATVANSFLKVADAPASGRVLNWVSKLKQMRYIRVEMLDWLDGSAGFERRSRVH